MRISTQRSSARQAGAVFALVLLAAALPAPARAQYGQAREFGQPSVTPAIGENYHVELGGTLWNPNLLGVISSEQFGLVGSQIDLVEDLGFEKTRFKDLRIVLRPTKKAKFRIQYTPVEYFAQTTLGRNLVFNGINFPVSLPVESKFTWNVWRFGYEYDFFYHPRGFVGVLVEGRYTTMSAELTSPINPTEFTTAKAPLPAIGVVARGYVLPEVALNFEVSGFKLPDVDPQYKASYFDWDIHGTVNLSNHVGVQLGWRKMTNFLTIKEDVGDLRFNGLWFGAAVRY